MKYILIALLGLALAGCDNGTRDDTRGASYAKELSKRTDYINPRDGGNGYVMYEIERGAVTCREHARRSELTCWKRQTNE